LPIIDEIFQSMTTDTIIVLQKAEFLNCALTDVNFSSQDQFFTFLFGNYDLDSSQNFISFVSNEILTSNEKLKLKIDYIEKKLLEKVDKSQKSSLEKKRYYYLFC
jgi:hypothetical protein